MVPEMGINLERFSGSVPNEVWIKQERAIKNLNRDAFLGELLNNPLVNLLMRWLKSTVKNQVGGASFSEQLQENIQG